MQIESPKQTKRCRNPKSTSNFRIFSHDTHSINFSLTSPEAAPKSPSTPPHSFSPQMPAPPLPGSAGETAALHSGSQTADIPSHHKNISHPAKRQAAPHPRCSRHSPQNTDIPATQLSYAPKTIKIIIENSLTCQYNCKI